MLQLDARETELLLGILNNALGDLRMTIADTENFDWRQDMKRDEEVIKGLIARLEREGPVPEARSTT
jgi:hypothetical protein